MERETKQHNRESDEETSDVTDESLCGLKKRTVVLDIEANGLKPTKIWCIVCKDVETGEVFKFRPKTPLSGHTDFAEAFLEFVGTVDTFIGHNLLGYDVWWLNKLIGTNIQVKHVVDTLVMSRLFRPVSPFKEQIKKLKTDHRLGGHSLGAWGDRLGFAKISFNEWDKYSEEMLDYCVQDVELNFKVYEALLKEGRGFSSRSIRLEHKVAWLLAGQERNGFYLDQKACTILLSETTELLDEMYEKLCDLFPPVPKLVREYDLRYKKDGSISAVSERIINSYRDDPDKELKEIGLDKYELYIYETFNPKSSKQIASRLLGIGWEPKKYTDKGNPSTDKETLKDALEELMVVNPELHELQYLGDYNIVADRQQKAKKWLELVEEDGRVHGRINPIGAGTHRCSHYADNMANIARVSHGSDGAPLKGLDGKFGWDSRACWSASGDETCIVGADASGIQLRALAHYMNDPEYIKKLLQEDIHVVNQLAAGISDRPKAKTFIYAWLLGAGDEKIGMIVGVTEAEFEDLFAFAKGRKVWGKPMLNYIVSSLKRKDRKASKRLVATIIKGFKVKEQFLESIPALKRLKQEDIPKDTKQGYLIGIDGRKLWIPNEHLAMSMYLQGFEAVIMKAAMVFYQEDLVKRGIPFKQVAFVHDEFQIETLRKYGDIVGQAVVDAIVKAGEVLGSRCPLDGEYKVGRNWAETH